MKSRKKTTKRNDIFNNSERKKVLWKICKKPLSSWNINFFFSYFSLFFVPTPTYTTKSTVEFVIVVLFLVVWTYAKIYIRLCVFFWPIQWNIWGMRPTTINHFTWWWCKNRIFPQYILVLREKSSVSDTNSGIKLKYRWGFLIRKPKIIKNLIEIKLEIKSKSIKKSREIQVYWVQKEKIRVKWKIKPKKANKNNFL